MPARFAESRTTQFSLLRSSNAGIHVRRRVHTRSPQQICGSAGAALFPVAGTASSQLSSTYVLIAGDKCWQCQLFPEDKNMRAVHDSALLGRTAQRVWFEGRA